LIGAVRTRTRAKRERSGSALPSRHLMVRQARFGRPSASALALTRSSRSATDRPRHVLDGRQDVGLMWCAPICQKKRSMSRRLPIFHWTAPWVRAHVLMCMLGYHV
jgi:hypothetical protein